MVGNEKIKKAVIATLLTILLATVAYASALWIYSNEVTTKIIGYNFHLEGLKSEYVRGESIIFSGWLTYSNGTGISNKDIYIQFFNKTASEWQTITSCTTDGSGNFTATWEATFCGEDITFRAACEVP